MVNLTCLVIFFIFIVNWDLGCIPLMLLLNYIIFQFQLEIIFCFLQNVLRTRQIWFYIWIEIELNWWSVRVKNILISILYILNLWKSAYPIGFKIKTCRLVINICQCPRFCFQRYHFNLLFFSSHILHNFLYFFFQFWKLLRHLSHTPISKLFMHFHFLISLIFYMLGTEIWSRCLKLKIFIIFQKLTKFIFIYFLGNCVVIGLT